MRHSFLKIIAIHVLAITIVLFLFKKTNTAKYVSLADSTSEECETLLVRELNILKTKARDLSILSKKCLKGESCTLATTRASDLVNDLDGKELGMRWDYFSCSPLLYSKLRFMRSRAESIKILSSLNIKTEGLDRDSKLILEPELFIENELGNIKRLCCHK